MHPGQRLRRGVTVLESLENRSAEGILGLLGNVGEELSVALDDEMVERIQIDVCKELARLISNR